VETAHQVNRLCPSDVSVDKVIALLGNQSDGVVPITANPEKKDQIEDLSMQQLQEITLLVKSGTN
jgi:hypothetical protein